MQNFSLLNWNSIMHELHHVYIKIDLLGIFKAFCQNKKLNVNLFFLKSELKSIFIFLICILKYLTYWQMIFLYLLSSMTLFQNTLVYIIWICHLVWLSSLHPISWYMVLWTNCYRHRSGRFSCWKTAISCYHHLFKQ